MATKDRTNDSELTHVKIPTVSKFYKLPQKLTARKDLNPSDKIVFAVILDFIGDNEYGWPGVRTLAKATGLFTATVVASLKRLEAVGLLNIQRRGNGKSSYYSLLKTVLKISTVNKSDRAENQHGGVLKISTEACVKLAPNQTDLLNQTKTPTAGAVELASFLLEKILARKSDFKKPSIPAWAVHIDRMLSIDHRKPEVIRQVIEWCQADSGNGKWRGWQDNVLSTAKLREQFDKLELAMRGQSRDAKPKAALPPIERITEGEFAGLTPAQALQRQIETEKQQKKGANKC
jgi:hypothetical protein